MLMKSTQMVYDHALDWVGQLDATLGLKKIIIF